MFTQSLRPLCLLAAALVPAVAQAQWRLSVAPVAGGVASTVRFGTDENGHRFGKGNQNRTPYRAGAEAGVLVSVGYGHWALQPSVRYAQRGYRQSFTIPGDRMAEQLDYAASTRLNYLTLPVHLVWSQRADGTGWQGFVGGFVSRWLTGSYKGTVAYTAVTTQGELLAPGTPIPMQGRVVDERRYREFQPYSWAHGVEQVSFMGRLDAGLQAGVGYRYRRFQVQASYSLGLRELSRRQFAAGVGLENMPYRSRAASLSLAYLLPLIQAR